MQRLHPEDLVGRLIDQGGWTHLDLPAIAEAETIIPLGNNRFYCRTRGNVLHSEREPLSALNELKRNMGSPDFAAQYQQQPISTDGNLIKWSWFRFYDDPPTPGPTDQIIVSWDTAMSSKELADYSVCVVLMVRRETVYVLDVFRAQLGYPDLRRKVIEIHRCWCPVTANYALLIEDKGSGTSLIQHLREDDIHAIGITPEGDKIMRMSAQTARIEAGAVLLPKWAHWLEELRRELLAFPVGHHNDQVDAFSQGLKRAFLPPPPAAVFGTYTVSSGNAWP